MSRCLCTKYMLLVYLCYVLLFQWVSKFQSASMIPSTYSITSDNEFLSLKVLIYCTLFLYGRDKFGNQPPHTPAWSSGFVKQLSISSSKMPTVRNARSLVTSRELPSGLQIWGKRPAECIVLSGYNEG